jgi:hypothetical protein
MKKQEKVPDLPRRDFLKGGSFAALMMLMGGVEIRAQEKSQEAGAVTEEKPLGAAVKCALIGCGNWGREILKTPIAQGSSGSDLRPVRTFLAARERIRSESG